MPHEFLKQIKGGEVRRPVLGFDAAARKLQHAVFCVDDVSFGVHSEEKQVHNAYCDETLGKNIMYALLQHAVQDKQAYHQKGHRA